MVDDRINHIPKEMPGRLVPDVQVPEDWFDDIGVVDERDDARRVAAQSVQLARHAAAIPAHSRVVSEQFEHFQQPATAGVVPETAILLHQLKQQLHGCFVVLFDHLAERQLVKGSGVVRIGRESGLEFGRGGGPGHLALEEQLVAQRGDFRIFLLVRRQAVQARLGGGFGQSLYNIAASKPDVVQLFMQGGEARRRDIR